MILSSIPKEVLNVLHIYIEKESKLKKDIMISLRITPKQYVTLLETLVREKKSKSQFIRESIERSLFRINDKSCRKKEILEWIDEL